MRFFLYFSLIASYLSLWILPTTTAYRIGDPVDTQVAWDTTQPIPVTQMPRFAIDSQTQVPLPGNDDATASSYATFSFEDGLWGLPAVTMTPTLERLVVQFVYSAGAIHSIHSEPVYNDELKHQQLKPAFLVHYVWTEEPHVTPEAGQAVMFLVGFGVSVWIVWTVLNTSEATSSSSSSAIPKYE